MKPHLKSKQYWFFERYPTQTYFGLMMHTIKGTHKGRSSEFSRRMDRTYIMEGISYLYDDPLQFFLLVAENPLVQGIAVHQVID